jgi:hypothetical protein
MKKLNSIFLLATLLLFFESCEKPKDKTIPYAPFNIANVKNISINTITTFENENLNNQGYYREVADVVIFNKQVKDTLTQLQFETNYGKLLYKTWYINLGNSHEKTIVNDIMYKHGIIMMSDFIYCPKDEDSYFFPAMNNSENIIFLCNVYKDENNYTLKVTYHNEITDLNFKDKIDTEYDEE